MRLLYVHECFGALGGAEANAHITAGALLERGHDIGLIHGPGTGNNERAWDNTFGSRFPLATRRTAECVERALSEFRPDAIYVHKMPDLSVLERLVTSGRPLVRMVHDHDIYCMRSYRYNYFTRRICTRPFSAYCVFPCGAFLVRNRQGRIPVRFVNYQAKRREIELNRQFHRMVVVTEYMKKELIRNGFDAEKIEVHPPIPRMGDPSIRSAFSERNLILFAGQIIRGKGVDILLRSLAQLSAPFECIILGDGNDRPRCERLCRKLGLQNRVRFAGFVSQDELKDYYRDCSVVAISSVWPEPIATIGLEVMRYGLPVVAFDAGGIRDWLIDGYNGFLVPWMDRAQYAARLDQLLCNKALARELGENGRELSEQKYNFPSYIARLEDLFERVSHLTAIEPG